MKESKERCLVRVGETSTRYPDYAKFVGVLYMPSESAVIDDHQVCKTCKTRHQQQRYTIYECTTSDPSVDPSYSTPAIWIRHLQVWCSISSSRVPLHHETMRAIAVLLMWLLLCPPCVCPWANDNDLIHSNPGAVIYCTASIGWRVPDSGIPEHGSLG